MRVPDEAASGKVKVRVSCPSWMGGVVAPATFEVPVIDAEAKK